MPTYDYVCDACEHAFEEFQSMTAKPLKKCPKCGKPKLRRLIGTGAGVIFKGSGFYETDYRSAGYKKDAEADKGGGKDGGKEGGKGEKKGEAKKDAKPAEKKATKADKPASESKPKPKKKD